MAHPARWMIKKQDDEHIWLHDLGPWHTHFTITNDVENVVASIADQLGNRRLLYTDSLGMYNEIIVVNGKFAGFKDFP